MTAGTSSSLYLVLTSRRARDVPERVRYVRVVRKPPVLCYFTVRQQDFIDAGLLPMMGLVMQYDASGSRLIPALVDNESDRHTINRVLEEEEANSERGIPW